LDQLKEILEIKTEEELKETNSLYLAMHYQFRGKLAARYLD
jgi:hypothetical protein